MADAWHEEKKLVQRIQEAVDRGATTAEEIHSSIASLPLEILENLGLFESTARDVKRIQEDSLGAIYDRIRDINHKVGRLAADLLESRESA